MNYKIREKRDWWVRHGIKKQETQLWRTDNVTLGGILSFPGILLDPGVFVPIWEKCNASR